MGTGEEKPVVMVLFGTMEKPADKVGLKTELLNLVLRSTPYESHRDAGNIDIILPVDDQKVPVRLFEVASGKERLRLSMVECRVGHVFLLCFSLFQLRSLEILEEVWLPEIRKLEPQRPIVLVGLEQERKETWDTEDHEKMEALGIKPIPPELIQAFQERNGIQLYEECSVETSLGIQELLRKAVTAGLQYKQETEADEPHEEEEKKQKKNGCSVA